MLNELRLKNFSVFSQARLRFAGGLNVIIGENGLGKTQLLKLPYAAMSVSAEGGKANGGRQPSKALLQRRIAEKLINVFRAEYLGRLVHRQQGRNRCEVRLNFGGRGSAMAFGFATQSKSEVSVSRAPSGWLDYAPVFIPTRELLTLYPGFVSLYETHNVEFEETWRDTCVLLGAPTLKGARESSVKKLLNPLEAQFGGRVVLERGRFYLKRPGEGNMEMPLVAEGWRKLAMLARLIATGSLLGKGCLFWDEPEANLNPRLIREVAKAVLNICQAGVQVFVATHSLFLLREFEILLKDEFSGVAQRYFALKRNGNAVEVSQGDCIDDVNPLVALDEDLAQSDRFVKEFSGNG